MKVHRTVIVLDGVEDTAATARLNATVNFALQPEPRALRALELLCSVLDFLELGNSPLARAGRASDGCKDTKN